MYARSQDSTSYIPSLSVPCRAQALGRGWHSYIREKCSPPVPRSIRPIIQSTSRRHKIARLLRFSSFDIYAKHYLAMSLGASWTIPPHLRRPPRLHQVCIILSTGRRCILYRRHHVSAVLCSVSTRCCLYTSIRMWIHQAQHGYKVHSSSDRVWLRTSHCI